MVLHRIVMQDTPIGPLQLVAQDHYIIRVDFVKPDLAEVERYLTKWVGEHTFEDRETDALRQARQELTEYFAGTRKGFDVKTKLFGTPFYLSCWRALGGIPYGETISYQELAQRVQSPRAYRAVGQANHNNPVAVIVPCHRVIGANQKLTGYGGGLELKKILLELEQRHK